MIKKEVMEHLQREHDKSWYERDLCIKLDDKQGEKYFDGMVQAYSEAIKLVGYIEVGGAR